MEDQAAIAGRLSADDYRRRLANIREIGDRAFLMSEDRPDGATLTFLNSGEVHEELEAIVQAESACCPFLVFGITERHDRLDLVISTPPEALPIVRDLVRSFRPGGAIA